MRHEFQMVDVFGTAHFSGNPLGVVLAAEELEPDQMQRIARWLNVSETTFLLPPTHPEADYRVRIFSPPRELPFAGHPTLGSCHAWLSAGGTPKNPDRMVQECGAGLIPIRRRDGMLGFAAPPLIRSGPVDEADLVDAVQVLGIDRSEIVEAQWVDNGPGWIGILLASAERVLALEPARHHPRRIDIGVVGPYPQGSAVAFELRAFFSDQHGGLIEDPITGSLNASVAQWLIGSGRAPASYVAAQGTAIGRQGRIMVARDDGEIWIAGRTTTIIKGEIDSGDLP